MTSRRGEGGCFSTAAVASLLVATMLCALGTPVSADDEEAAAKPWSLAEEIEALRRASCPDPQAAEAPASITIDVTPVTMPPAPDYSTAVNSLRLMGAWELDSRDRRFGGLSGLALTADGSLLAVGDKGIFVWIGRDATSGAPNGSGALAKMLDDDGALLRDKKDSDAEGLALHEGLALVSFERKNRIEAFDLKNCGSAARAARVSKLKKKLGGRKYSENDGAEALMLGGAGDRLYVGIEEFWDDGSPIATLYDDGKLRDVRFQQQPNPYRLTGLDTLGTVSAKLYRDYHPTRGNSAILDILEGDVRIASARIDKSLPLDNFEGVALERTKEGVLRVWLISDDNFNFAQQTLLVVFDVEPTR